MSLFVVHSVHYLTTLLIIDATIPGMLDMHVHTIQTSILLQSAIGQNKGSPCLASGRSLSTSPDW